MVKIIKPILEYIFSTIMKKVKKKSQEFLGIDNLEKVIKELEDDPEFVQKVTTILSQTQKQTQKQEIHAGVSFGDYKKERDAKDECQKKLQECNKSKSNSKTFDKNKFQKDFKKDMEELNLKNTKKVIIEGDMSFLLSLILNDKKVGNHYLAKSFRNTLLELEKYKDLSTGKYIISEKGIDDIKEIFNDLHL